MSAGFNEIFPAVDAPKRLRGRPRSTKDPAQRRQHIALALIYFGSNWTLTHIAKMYDVSPDTASRWIRQALTYEEPEADRLRYLAKHCNRHRINHLNFMPLEFP